MLKFGQIIWKVWKNTRPKKVLTYFCLLIRKNSPGNSEKYFGRFRNILGDSKNTPERFGKIHPEYLVTEAKSLILTMLSGATWWPNLQLMKVAPPGEQIVNNLQIYSGSSRCLSKHCSLKNLVVLLFSHSIV